MSQRESIVKAKVPPHSPLNEDTMQYETPTWNFKREFKKQKKKLPLQNYHYKTRLEYGLRWREVRDLRI